MTIKFHGWRCLAFIILALAMSTSTIVFIDQPFTLNAIHGVLFGIALAGWLKPMEIL